MILQHLDTVIAFAVVMLGVSLLITVATQLIAGLLATRGRYLRDGVAELLGAVHPSIRNHAKEIAEKALRHSLISDSYFGGRQSKLNPWSLATAIRVEELIGILDKLRGAIAAPVPPAPITSVEQAMAYIVQRANAEASPEVEALAQQVTKISGAVAGAAAAPTLALDKIVEQVRSTATSEAQLTQLKSWFDSAMDRVSQRFTMHARIVTIVFSLAFALLSHFDAVDLLKRLATDADLRAKLVASADTMTKQAEKILPPSPAPADDKKDIEAAQRALKDRKHDPGPLDGAKGKRTEKALKSLQKAEGLKETGELDTDTRAKLGLPEKPGPEDVTKSPVPGVYRNSMVEILDKKIGGTQDAEAKKRLDEVKKSLPAQFASREDAAQWLRRSLSGDPALENLVAQYGQTLDQKLSQQGKLLDQAASITWQLGQSGFQLFKSPYPGLVPAWDEVPGILAAAAFLSLGAPFWFNALKTLSNLRPLIASKQEKEQQEKGA